MKRTTFLLLTFLLATAQLPAKELLDRVIDVQFVQTPLKDALVIIAQKGGFELSYNASILDGNKKVNLQANDWTIRETMLTLLGKGYAFRSNGNYLIIKREKQKADQISGYIKDPKTGDRIVGATVFDKKSLRATTTDSNGYYSLKVKRSADVVVSKLNFRDTTLEIRPQTPRFAQVEIQRIPLDTSPKPFDLDLQVQRVEYLLNRFFNASVEKWHDLNLRDSLHRTLQVSLVPMIGSNHALSGKVSNDWSLNIIAGYSQGVERVELGGIGNFTRDHVRGVQIGGAFNLNSGNTYGIQVAGIHNQTSKILSGLQISGFSNYANRSTNGIGQISGTINVLPKGTTSLQIGGAANYADTIKFIQLAGIINKSKVMHGLQVGGAANRSGSTRGVQVAGIVNSAQSANGVQVAGLLNHAQTMRGFQFAIFNTTQECSCVQVGLLNRVGRRWLPFMNIGRLPKEVRAR